MRWRIKRDTNDELRQSFVDVTVPAGRRTSASRSPIPTCAGTRPTAHYDFGAIDWDEFYAVVRGDGPGATSERMEARRERTGTTAPGCARRPLAHAEKQAARRDGGLHDGHERASDWPLWEVFVRAQTGSRTSTSAACTPPTPRWRIEHARDVYTRRKEGVSLWVVRSADITASDPGETDPLFEPARDKVYRHPTFYEIPDDVKHL